MFPKIYNYNKSGKLFYYNMEYINGPTLSLYLMSQPISETKIIIDSLIDFIFNCKKNSNLKYNQSKFLNKIKDLQTIEKFHKEMNGKLREELDLEKKNHAITREDVQLKDIEIGRMMEKLHK